MKLRLTIDVDYEPKGVSKTALVGLLEDLVRNANENDEFTGTTDAEVRSLDFRIDPSDDQPGEEPCVIAFGNPFDGMSLYGPFMDAEKANEWAERDSLAGEGWLNIKLRFPE